MNRWHKYEDPANSYSLEAQEENPFEAPGRGDRQSESSNPTDAPPRNTGKVKSSRHFGDRKPNRLEEKGRV